MVSEFTWSIAQAIRAYADRKAWSRFLLRHDKNPERPPYPAGGYLIPLSQLDNEVAKYFEDNRVVLLLAPYDPLDNGYNASALLVNDGRVTLEIVGPGFDASDLQRGSFSPHEVLDIRLDMVSGLRRVTVEALRAAVRRRFLVESGEYRASVERRIQKIYDKFVKREVAFGRVAPQGSPIHQVVLEYLKANNHRMLLDNQTSYSPMPDSSLVQVVGNLVKFQREYSKFCTLQYPSVLASSFVNNGVRLVFWDVVNPRLKYSH